MSKLTSIVVGASAGGIQALEVLLKGLPSDLGAAVVIVLHIPPQVPSHLPETLQRKTVLRVSHAQDGELIRPDCIYIAQPDLHLIIERNYLRNTRGPKENRSRPAIDSLFRSAAYTCGERVIGILLSGANDDGTAGLWSIKDRGGTVIVQDPNDALYELMPQNAIQYVKVDQVLPASKIGPILKNEVRLLENRAPAKAVSRELEIETKIAMEGRGLQLGVMGLGPVTPYVCPECHGVLVSLNEGGMPRFRCHTGHAYSINSLLEEVTRYVEVNLWNGMRAIEESMMLMDHLAKHLKKDSSNDPRISKRLLQKSKEAEKRADTVRSVLMSHQGVSVSNISKQLSKRSSKKK